VIGEAEAHELRTRWQTDLAMAGEVSDKHTPLFAAGSRETARRPMTKDAVRQTRGNTQVVGGPRSDDSCWPRESLEEAAARPAARHGAGAG